MKKLMSILLPALASFTFLIGAQAMPTADPGVEEIKMKTQNDVGDERGGFAPVEAYLFHSTNTLYIALAYSVGSATITVTDSFGTTVYTDIVDATLVGFTQFAAPTASGTYTLEVQSATYYGTGTFNI